MSRVAETEVTYKQVMCMVWVVAGIVAMILFYFFGDDTNFDVFIFLLPLACAYRLGLSLKKTFNKYGVPI